MNIRIEALNVYHVNMESPAVSNRSSYHHGDLKAAFIEAGLQALTSMEADDLSLRMLAKQVGVSANAAYRHFEDKDDLLSAMAAEGFRRFSQSQHDSVKAVALPMDRLRASGLAYVQFAQRHPALYRLMFQRLACVVEHSELHQQSMESMTVLLEAASTLLHAPAFDERVRVAAAACWSLVHGLSSLAMGGQLGVFGMALPELIERVMSLPGLVLDQTVAMPESRSSA